MDSNTLIGAVVTALVAIIGLVSPILKLNASIVTLGNKIDALNADSKRNEERITKHGAEIEVLEKDSVKHSILLQDHEERLKDLEKSK